MKGCSFLDDITDRLVFEFRIRRQICRGFECGTVSGILLIKPLPVLVALQPSFFPVALVRHKVVLVVRDILDDVGRLVVVRFVVHDYLNRWKPSMLC